MTGKKRDTSRKRESILDAAVQAFRDEGYESASMDRIAEIAGASKRTVYNHFPSKEALFQATLDRFMDETSALKNIPYDPDRRLDDQLAEFADAKVSVMENPVWQGLLKVTLGVFIREPELAEKTLAQASAGENTLVIWLNEAVKDGRLKMDDVKLVAELFWAMVSGALFWPQMLQGPMDPERVKVLKEEIIQTFLGRYEV